MSRREHAGLQAVRRWRWPRSIASSRSRDRAQRHDRGEDLLAHQLRVELDVREQRRGQHRAVALAADQHSRAGAGRHVDPVSARVGRGRRRSADRRRSPSVARVAGAQRADAARPALPARASPTPALHEHALHRGAHLPGLAVAGAHDQVRALSRDPRRRRRSSRCWRRARGGSWRCPSRCLIARPTARRAGEREVADAPVGHELLAHAPPGADHELQPAGRQAGVHQGLRTGRPRTAASPRRA